MAQFLKHNGAEFNGEVKSKFCDACIVGKMHRLRFKRNDVISSPGDRINGNVCETMHTVSVGGSRYFVNFKDGFYKYRAVYFLSEKSEIRDKHQQFLAEIKTIGHLVKEFLTDNGKEFIKKGLQEVTQKGIYHRTSMSYTPKQNCESVRENRTLVESARTMLHGYGLLEKLWEDAVMTASYVIKRTGSSAISDVSPYDLTNLYHTNGKNTSIKNLKVFGTECFVHVPKEKRKKFDQKARKGFLVGYFGDQDGYRAYIPEDSEVILSRDIVFKEERLSLII